MIFPTWQSLANSTHKIAQSFAEKLGEKTTHTGTLDPMAEGVVVLLTGDDRIAKGQLADWKKEYSYSILWGIATDSGDCLGLITRRESVLDDVILSQLPDVLQNFPHSYKQTMHPFSSQRWQGKSGFELTKAGTSFPLKNRQITIEKNQFLSHSCMSVSKILREHQRRIELVTGDFRQSEIIAEWKKMNSDEKKKETFLITHHQATVSTGTYIRQLVQDLASQMHVSATTWSITRTKNGPYEKMDCVCLDEL